MIKLLTFLTCFIILQKNNQNLLLKYKIIVNNQDSSAIINCTTVCSESFSLSTNDSITNMLGKFGNFSNKIPKNEVYQFKDFRNKLIISTQGKKLVLKDTMNVIKWKITKDKVNIGGFECIKAIGKLYGRVYEVWYAPKIPISSGPWKFYGLPGLVLEANEINGNIKFVFTSIQFNKAILKIDQPPVLKSQKIVGKNEYLKLLRIQQKKDEKPIITSKAGAETIVTVKSTDLEIW